MRCFLLILLASFQVACHLKIDIKIALWLNGNKDEICRGPNLKGDTHSCTLLSAAFLDFVLTSHFSFLQLNEKLDEHKRHKNVQAKNSDSPHKIFFSGNYIPFSNLSLSVNRGLWERGIPEDPDH
jgi:hypothetical protein